MGVGGQLHAPAALPPGKRLGTHCTGAWMGPRAGLDGCRKSRTPPGFAPRTVQPVANHYTDYAIPAHYEIPVIIRLTSPHYMPGIRRLFCLSSDKCAPNHSYISSTITYVHVVITSGGLGLKILVARRQRGPTHNYMAII
jgi:hypothetical protein